MARHNARGGALEFSSPWLYSCAMTETTVERRHSAQINFRITPEHDQLIREAAEHSGATLTNWIRSVLVKAAREELGR